MGFGSGRTDDVFDCLARVVVATMIDATEIDPARRGPATDSARTLLLRLAGQYSGILPPFYMASVFRVEGAAKMVREGVQHVVDSLADGGLVASMWAEPAIEGINYLVAVVGDDPGDDVRRRLSEILAIGAKTQLVSDQQLSMLYRGRPAALAAKAVSDEHGEPLREAMDA